jgi:cytochrome c
LVGIGGGCLSAKLGDSADGTPVELWPCLGGAAYQFWTAAKGQIVGTGSRKCLEAKGGGGADGAAIDIRTCSGAPNQRWAVQGTEIVGVGGKCLGVQGGGGADGSAIDLEPCDSQPNQIWQVHQPD